ncbi:hypothetical protein QEG73_22990 [Chitinophagaceae bacterium 26-R-25]|nr:hypothetical protein [Chitinophagaceae bacterium 26-R-25]
MFSFLGSMVMLLLLPSIIFISCKQEEENATKDILPTEDLFAADNLYTKEPQVSSQPALKTVVDKSDLVAIGTILSIDSIVHNTEKAPFYLVCVQLDSIIKSKWPINKRLYFFERTTPAFNKYSAGNMLFIRRRKLTKNDRFTNVLWQWTPDAPHVTYDSCKTVFNSKQYPAKPLKLHAE